MLSKRVGEFIRQQQLLEHNKRYIIALSGGADSIALTLILKELGYDIEAAHCNFNLRGKESQRDEQFVISFCQAQGIPLHRIHFDTHTYAQLHKVSIEMAARQLRYHYFEQLRNDLGAEAICVAHHRDDSVETMLINLIHGTGIHGLVGIRARNGHILRPLLCANRKEIEDYLAQRQQPFVTDSTNLVPDVLRNKVRLQLMPLLKTLNPAIADNLQTTMKQLAEAELVYDQSVSSLLSKAVSGNSLPISELRKSASPESVLFEWLRTYNFSPAVVRQIYEHIETPSPGKLWSSATHEVIIDRGLLIAEPLSAQLPSLVVPETGIYRYEGKGRMGCHDKIAAHTEEKFSFQLKSGAMVLRNQHAVGLDAHKVMFPLTIRPVQQGDRFVPFGMKGSKLLSDYMTDLKFTLFEKRRQLVVADAQGHIVWVVGQRCDNRCRITSDTQQTLIIELLTHAG